jgi:leader peptidase (prepilin peptidase)/N-methyltransferase
MEISIKLLISGLLGAALLRLAIIDLRTFRLPDIYTLPLILTGVTINAVIASGVPHDAVWGAMVGYSVFWGLGTWFFTRTGREGLGLGDAKLLAAAGAWVGITYLPAVLLLAAGGALTVALTTRTKTKEAIAFGPWLAGAFWVVWVAKLIKLHNLMPV